MSTRAVVICRRAYVDFQLVLYGYAVFWRRLARTARLILRCMRQHGGVVHRHRRLHPVRHGAQPEHNKRNCRGSDDKADAADPFGRQESPLSRSVIQHHSSSSTVQSRWNIAINNHPIGCSARIGQVPGQPRSRRVPYSPVSPHFPDRHRREQRDARVRSSARGPYGDGIPGSLAQLATQIRKRLMPNLALLKSTLTFIADL
jgi:hypothetical protein